MRLRQLLLRHAELLVVCMMRPNHCLAVRDQFKQYGCCYRRACERRLKILVSATFVETVPFPDFVVLLAAGRLLLVACRRRRSRLPLPSHILPSLGAGEAPF